MSEFVETLSNYVDFSQRSFKIAALSIAFNPIFWNIAARTEYNTRLLTKIFRSPYTGCYALGITIFSLGILRDNLYHKALADQPYYEPVHQPYLAYVLFAVGNVLVLSSMWALGITGTYLGDYFGILMDAPVTGFPFNISGAPMYWGSTMSFLAVALYYGKVAGLVLTAEVFVMYWLALRWEDPFTAEIYAKRDRERAKKSS
ncbi:hypothetical protein VTN49DRAFT_6506 [Thermomyces lanuginosus]|uniref:uncharacterized protein n=1 Tax=Thermomyces lanuginosus TaxID=5541 RepID=UPI003743A110